MSEVIDWGKELEDAGVLWRRDNSDAARPHAQWTSGNHADGYCNCAKIVTNPALLEKVAAAMIENVRPHLGDIKPDYVVGPAYGAITIAHEVARQLGTLFAFTEVEHTDEGKMQVMKRFDIPQGARVLVVEDVVSTGGSAQKTVSVLEDMGVEVLPFIPIIMNWSGSPESKGKKLISLIEGKIDIQEPEKCTLCEAGSKPLRPKANWSELVG